MAGSIPPSSPSPLQMGRSPFSLKRTFSTVSLESVGNRSIPDFADCQTSRTYGVYNREANAHAISNAYRVMLDARENLGRRDLKAMDKALHLLGRQTTEHYGNNVLVHLTALGAMHAGISKGLLESPGDARLSNNLVQIEKAIIDIGIKAGNCKGGADGGYHGDGRSKALTDSMARSRDKILGAIADDQGRQLLERIAVVLLAEPVRKSILERQGQANLDAFISGAHNPMEAVHKQMADDLEKVLQIHLDNGGAYDYMQAIVDLIKLAEYVVERDPGRDAAPERPGRGNPPPLTPEQVRQLGGPNAPLLYNYSPTNVDNNVSELVRALREQQPQQPPLQLTDMQGLNDRAYERGIKLGEAQMLNRWQASIIADLQGKLQRQNERLELFATRSNNSSVRGNPSWTRQYLDEYQDSGRGSVGDLSDIDDRADDGSSASVAPTNDGHHNSGPGLRDGHRRDDAGIYENLPLRRGSSSIASDARHIGDDESSDGTQSQFDPYDLPPLLPRDYDAHISRETQELSRDNGGVDDSVETDVADDAESLFDLYIDPTLLSLDGLITNQNVSNDANRRMQSPSGQNERQSAPGSSDDFIRLLDDARKRGERVRPSNVLAARGLALGDSMSRDQTRTPENWYRSEGDGRDVSREVQARTAPVPFGRTRVSETPGSAPHRAVKPAFGLNAPQTLPLQRIPAHSPFSQVSTPAMQPIAGQRPPAARGPSWESWVVRYAAASATSTVEDVDSSERSESGGAGWMTPDQERTFERLRRGDSVPDQDAQSIGGDDSDDPPLSVIDSDTVPNSAFTSPASTAESGRSIVRNVQETVDFGSIISRHMERVNGGGPFRGVLGP